MPPASTTTAPVDYSIADLSALVPTEAQVRERMGEGWTFSRSEKASFMPLGYFAFSVPSTGYTSTNPATASTSECRNKISSERHQKWTEGINISGTNSDNEDAGLAVLKFKSPADATAYIEDERAVLAVCTEEAELDPSVAKSMSGRKAIPTKIDGAFTMVTTEDSRVDYYGLVARGSLVTLVTSFNRPSSAAPLDYLMKLEDDTLATWAAANN